MPGSIHLRLAQLRGFPSADAALCLPGLAGHRAADGGAETGMGAAGAVYRLRNAAGRYSADRDAEGPVMSQFLYHMAKRADWEQAEAAGVYRGSADDARDGFM